MKVNEAKSTFCLLMMALSQSLIDHDAVCITTSQNREPIRSVSEYRSEFGVIQRGGLGIRSEVGSQLISRVKTTHLPYSLTVHDT